MPHYFPAHSRIRRCYSIFQHWLYTIRALWQLPLRMQAMTANADYCRQKLETLACQIVDLADRQQFQQKIQAEQLRHRRRHLACLRTLSRQIAEMQERFSGETSRQLSSIQTLTTLSERHDRKMAKITHSVTTRLERTLSPLRKECVQWHQELHTLSHTIQSIRQLQERNKQTNRACLQLWQNIPRQFAECQGVIRQAMTPQDNQIEQLQWRQERLSEQIQSAVFDHDQQTLVVIDWPALTRALAREGRQISPEIFYRYLDDKYGAAGLHTRLFAYRSEPLGWLKQAGFYVVPVDGNLAGDLHQFTKQFLTDKRYAVARVVLVSNSNLYMGLAADIRREYGLRFEVLFIRDGVDGKSDLGDVAEAIDTIDLDYRAEDQSLAKNGVGELLLTGR